MSAPPSMGPPLCPCLASYRKPFLAGTMTQRLLGVGFVSLTTHQGAEAQVFLGSLPRRQQPHLTVSRYSTARWGLL